MPCRDYYDDLINAREEVEKKFSKIACFLDEVYSNKPLNIKGSYWRGCHPLVAGKNISQNKRDDMVRQLCSKCQEIDITKYSLELQIWWRDHQEEDKARLEAEARAIELKRQKDSALAKLTIEEQKLLGLLK